MLPRPPCRSSRKRLGHVAGATSSVSRLTSGSAASGMAAAAASSSADGLERLDLLGDQLDLARLLVVDAAAHQHHGVGLDLRRAAAYAELNTSISTAALEVVERGEHHRVALARADALALGDHAADQRPTRRPACARAGRPASTRPLARSAARTSLSGWLERNRPSVSFSQALSCARSSSSGGTGRSGRPRGRRRRARAPPRSKIDDWPSSASCWAFWPAPCACSST